MHRRTAPLSGDSQRAGEVLQEGRAAGHSHAPRHQQVMTSSVHRVKEELGHLKPSRHCCQVAELSALLHMDGSYTIRGSEGHVLVTESSGVYTARKIYSLVHTLFELETPVIKVTRSTPRRGDVYRLEIHEQPGFQQALNELGVLDVHLSPEPVVPRRLTRNDCCAASALRGAFLGGG